MSPRLSKRQANALYFLIDFMREKRYAPSLTEIAQHFDVSYGAAMSWALALEKKITSRSCEMLRVASAGLM